MISVDDLAVDLGGSRILEGVSFDVDAGEFVALVGPNGAGKTTLLRTVNGIVTPAAGTVRVDGDDVTLNGAIATHLENIERNEGYKGFNKAGIDGVLRKLDPRAYGKNKDVVSGA